MGKVVKTVAICGHIHPSSRHSSHPRCWAQSWRFHSEACSPQREMWTSPLIHLAFWQGGLVVEPIQRNLQQDPLKRDPEKTWVVNGSSNFLRGPFSEPTHLKRYDIVKLDHDTLGRQGWKLKKILKNCHLVAEWRKWDNNITCLCTCSLSGRWQSAPNITQMRKVENRHIDWTLFLSASLGDMHQLHVEQQLLVEGVHPEFLLQICISQVSPPHWAKWWQWYER